MQTVVEVIAVTLMEVGVGTEVGPDHTARQHHTEGTEGRLKSRLVVEEESAWPSPPGRFLVGIT